MDFPGERADRALALLLALPLLPKVAGTGLGTGLDLGGTVTVIAAPVLGVYGIINAGHAADIVELTTDQIAKLDNLTTPAGEHHGEAQMRLLER